MYVCRLYIHAGPRIRTKWQSFYHLPFVFCAVKWHWCACAIWCAVRVQTMNVEYIFHLSIKPLYGNCVCIRSAMLCRRKMCTVLTSARTTLMAAIIVMFFLQPTYTFDASSTPWPYLQIYPPVNESDARKPLYFALMLSFGGDYTSIGALPGVQIALDYVNSNPSLLPGYSLHYTLTDSRV